jgi:hypothetical protein
MSSIIYFPLGALTIFFMNKYEFWTKWKKLNSLVTCKTNNVFLIQYYSMQLLLNTLWIKLLVYLNNTVKECGKNKYEVSYILHGKTYKIRTNIKKGPSPIYKICDGDKNDITDIILPLMGPNYDWHNNIFTPNDLGFESIMFELVNERGLTFKENDKIKIDY